MRRRLRGNLLLMVLLVFLLLTALVMGVASTAYLVQRSSDEFSRQSMVRNLGDSVLAMTIAKVREDSGFHSRVEYSDERGQAVVSFETGHSTNNVLGDGAKQGVDGSVVPPGTCQLVAEVSYRGRPYRSVVMIGKSPFPYVVASSGAFTSNGSLLLGALRSLEDLADGLAPDDLVKGSLLTNAGLTISGPAEVIGDLKTASTASLTGVNQRQGKLTENAKPEDIPQIRLSDYDPAGKPEIIEYRTAPSSRVKLELSGLARSSVDVVLNEGLNLNGGVLYVDGDLNVAKGVTGYGAVFATGAVNVTGGSDLGSDSLCALVSGGNLTIHGDGADKTQFRGLVYSYGELNVSDVTIVGSLVGASASGRPMTVERANLVYDPEGVKIDLDLQWSGVEEEPNARGYVTLNRRSELTPSLFAREQRAPTPAEIREMLLWNVRRETPRNPTEEEMLSEPRLIFASDAIKAQAESLKSSPVAAKFHLDLNRFVRATDAMNVIFRRD